MIRAKTVVLLPARNEEQAITRVVNDVLNSCECDVVVACSACTDDTVGRVMQIRNDRVHCLANAPLGKGRAVRYALKLIDANKVVMLDSDGTYPAKRIPDFIKSLDIYEAVVGKRQMDNDNMPWGNKYSNRFVSLQARLLYGIPIKDLCSGMWGFRGDVYKAMDIRSPGFTLETEMFYWLSRHHLKWTHIPIEYYPRIGERQIHRMDHLKIWAAIWTRRFGDD